MPQNLAELREMLNRVRPWVGAAVILAVLLLGYYLVQGWRYWQATGDSSSLEKGVEKLDKNIALIANRGESIWADLERQPLQKPPVAELRDRFSEQPVLDLMAVVANTADRAAVSLTSLNPQPQETRVIGRLQYQVQTLSISVEGSTTAIYDF